MEESTTSVKANGGDNKSDSVERLSADKPLDEISLGSESESAQEPPIEDININDKISHDQNEIGQESEEARGNIIKSDTPENGEETENGEEKETDKETENGKDTENDELPPVPPKSDIASSVETNGSHKGDVSPAESSLAGTSPTGSSFDDTSSNLAVPSSSRGQTHTRKSSSMSVAAANATVDNTHIFKKTFDLILVSKDAKKNEKLRNTVQGALDSLKSVETRDPRVIFDTLKTICEESKSSELKAIAIDLFAKLFDYAQFEDPRDKVKLTDDSVEVISSCFDGEGTDPELELQIVRALMHSVLLMPCHGASLLSAVRQIYNVFIFSLSARNQAVAQGILTQVIGAIFQRITDSGDFKKSKTGSSPNLRSASNISKEDIDLPQDKPRVPEKLTLKNLERLNDDTNDDVRVREANRASEGDADLVVKDAFLIFRSMCKLSVKSVESETLDMKSHSVRSKLLSLHIIHTILKEHIDVFLSHDVVILSSSSNEQTRLINVVRQYICLSLSRNAASPLAPVFELSLEIFWLIISNLRSEFKREIPVFWDEIYFPVAEMKTSTPHQKRYLLSIIEKLCNDSRCIIEFYLNYDCDSSMSSICEKIIDYLTKLSLIRVDVTAQQKAAFQENRRNGISVYDITKIANLTSSTMSSKPPEPEVYNHFPLEYALKMTAINCSVAFLRSLYSWAHKGINNGVSHIGKLTNTENSSHLSLQRNRSGTIDSNSSTGYNTRSTSFVNNVEQATETDDPEQFQKTKQRKKAYLEGIKQFNQKAKKGIAYFIENNFIESDNPSAIAKLLLETEGLDKAMLGEYLGEGDEKNVAIMHAFVDQLEFNNTDFVDSLRKFLQSFRLPGESQKIDRFMLKFAERYVLGNPNVFLNADTAYVLAYSVIMLNTDQHSPQVKRKMTIDNFVTNNAGVNDGTDLPRDFLQKIFDEIQSNEIKLQSEQHAALLAGDLAIPNANSSIGFFNSRDLNREAYVHASKEMSTKTEKLVRNLGKKLKSDDSNDVFFVASNIHHVKSIFDTVWMSILAGLTPPFKEYDEEETAKICLEGIKLSIRIACMFDLDYARTSFIGALAQFQNLHNYEEMRPKNVDAIYIMLEIAVSEGNYLKGSWVQVLTSISQLERLQLIAQGVDQDTIPDVSSAKLVNRNSLESSRRASASFFSQFTTPTSASQNASNKFHNQHLTYQVAQLLTKTELEVSIDKIFTNSSNLKGESIVEFVKALSEVAAEEIESSGQSSNPRTFSLQKVVDICYYNMNRIRLEWSQMWAIMGETFNAVGCHSNSAISFFALDSLRQLSMRFLEIDELAHFKFQKEFLRPFEYVMLHNESLEVKDMVLDCINNMILARAGQIKSGWKTIFGVLTAGAKENKESLVMKSYKMANWINKEYIDEIRSQESFPDLVICFTELAKNERYQRASLLSLDVLSKLINQIAQITFGPDGSWKQLGENGVLEGSSEKYDSLVKLWFPVLFAFHDIIMTGEELEVRSRALSYLFSILMDYGEFFEDDFWDLICRQLLFPIFSVLNNHWELNLDDTNDKLSVWLSTTLIQALKSMITLLTHYFGPLSKMLDGYLNLIISCICQENDTIARIGRECLSTLLIDNISKFHSSQWVQVVDAFSTLFDLTTAKELFTSDPLKNRTAEDDQGDFGSDIDLNSPEALSKSMTMHDAEARLKQSREKSTIVVKSVLQLLLIQTLSELFENDIFYETVPYEHLMKMAALLKKSYNFAKKFNDDYDLRVRLWNAGVIERLPNLMKQESSSSAVYINIMFRMYCDEEKTDAESKNEIMASIVPLCNTINERYSEFDETNQQKFISTWKPVIVEIYQGYVELDDDDFTMYAPIMYKLTLKLFSKTMSADIRIAVRTFLARVGQEFIKYE